MVLRGETGLYVIDSGGVRWAKEAERPHTTSTIRGVPVVSGLDGLVVRGQFVAYADAGAVVVRSLADGTTLVRSAVATQGHTTLRTLSEDGRMLALVTVDPELEAKRMVTQVPWTITVVDLATGAMTVQDDLASFVATAIAARSNEGCGLVALEWLPNGNLLVGVTGNPYKTYHCDPAVGTFREIAGLQYVETVGPEGMVLGEDLKTRQHVVWDAGTVEPVVPDPEWPYVGHGAFSADGRALVLMVWKTEDAMLSDPHGWQVFAKSGSEWRPSGPAAPVDWMNQPPWVASRDGQVAWTVAYQSTSDNHTTLVSHDFSTGRWDTWLGPGDLHLDLGSYYYAGVIPE